MLDGLRGRIPHGMRTSFSSWPRIRPENDLPSPVFFRTHSGARLASKRRGAPVHYQDSKSQPRGPDAVGGFGECKIIDR